MPLIIINEDLDEDTGDSTIYEEESLDQSAPESHLGQSQSASNYRKNEKNEIKKSAGTSVSN